MGAGGLKVASIVAQAPAPGLKYLGDQEVSLGQELVGLGVGESTDAGESHWEVSDPHLCFLCAVLPPSCSHLPRTVVKSDPQLNFLPHKAE